MVESLGAHVSLLERREVSALVDVEEAGELVI